MSTLQWKRIYQAGSLVCVLVLAGTLYVHVNAAPPSTATDAFKPTGQTAHDVVQALVALDKLDVAPGNPTSGLARRAILEAERGFGLPTDGIADQALLDHLVADLAASRVEPAAGSNWTLDDGIKLTELIGGVATLAMTVLGFLGFRRGKES